MKAIQYLQNIGAIPKFDVHDLKMSVITISREFFTEEMMMEPDCVAWTQKAQSTEEFIKRCDVIAYATTGNVPELLSSLEGIDNSEDIRELIEELLEIRLFYHSMFLDESRNLTDLEGEEWFVQSYNSLVGLGPEESFPSKSQILRFFFCGALNEAGEEIVKEINGRGKV